jgi:hypothetical protein
MKDSTKIIAGAVATVISIVVAQLLIKQWGLKQQALKQEQRRQEVILWS